jgi:dynein heavy chain
LTSGEIIPLSETNRIMFEVEDLAVASPATVSRCGMIYVEPQYLLPDRMKPTEASKTPLFTSWLEQLKSPIDAHRETLRALIDEYIVPCTELLRLELKQPVPAVMPNTVAGVMRLLDALFIPYLPEEGAEPDPEKEKAIKEALPTYITPLFFSALIWAVGGTCEPESRAKFDTFLRGKIKEKGTKVSIPTDATVYDFVYDPPTNTWRRWASIIDPFSISDKTNFQADYNSLIVPTAASICYTSLLNTLLLAKMHTLIVGQTGTAKSVVVNNKLGKLDSKYLGTGPCPGFEPILMAFSAQTSANQTQNILDGKFEKRRQGVDKDTGLQYTMWGPMLGKQFAIFIDGTRAPETAHTRTHAHTHTHRSAFFARHLPPICFVPISAQTSTCQCARRTARSRRSS